MINQILRESRISVQLLVSLLNVLLGSKVQEKNIVYNILLVSYCDFYIKQFRMLYLMAYSLLMVFWAVFHLTALAYAEICKLTFAMLFCPLFICNRILRSTGASRMR